MEIICLKCTKHADCGLKCEAWKKLFEIRNKTRNKERYQLIRKYRRQLGIVDAEPSRKLQQLAEKIIEKFSEELSVISDYGVRIGYVMSQETPQGTKVKYADCEKVKVKYKAWLPFDFIITFYEPNVELLSENQRKILMLHELKHIGTGEKGLRLEEHDIDDFKTVLERFGIRWNDPDTDVIDILD